MHAIDALHSVRMLARAAPLILTLGATAGCATLRTTLRGYDVGPNGIARPQHRLREALALVTNDNARPYRPRRTERLFIPYFGMLAYARAGSWSDAAVEARRLVALITQHESDREERELPLHATLEHLAGAVLERAGYADEAQVAYRIANRLHGLAPERIGEPGPGDGEVLVVLERGFVAHRVTERIDVYVGDDDDHRRGGDPRRERDTDADADTRTGADPRRPTNASSVIPAAGAPAPDSARPPRRRRKHDRDDDAEYWIAIAFPVLRHSGWGGGATAQLRVDTTVAETTVRLSSLVDDAAAADEHRDRLAMLARGTARAGAKYALAKAAKDAKGEFAGTLANYGASLLERADVRSWHLLPRELQLLRARVPAGMRSVRVEVSSGRTVRTIDLGTMTVRPGELTIVPVRVWREGPSPEAIAVR